MDKLEKMKFAYEIVKHIQEHFRDKLHKATDESDVIFFDGVCEVIADEIVNPMEKIVLDLMYNEGD